MSISVSLGLWKPWVQTAVKEFDLAWPTLSWGTYAGHDPDRSLATDGMVPSWSTAAGNALGWKAAKELWADRVRLGIWYIIFDGKIISQTRPSAGWQPYFARNDPNPSKSHKNHIHVSFYDKAPAGWTAGVNLGQVWVDLLVPGVVDSTSIRLVQRALGVPETGTLDATTIAASKAFQASLGDAVDGLLGKLQVTRLFEDRKLNVEIRTDASGKAPKPTPTPPPVPEPEPELPPPPTFQTYTVKKGDTLSGIAGRFGLDWRALAALNPAIDPNAISIGQTLSVPAGAVEVKPTPTPEPTPPKGDDVSYTETIFGLNILRRTDEVAGRKRWPTRKGLIGKTLRAAKASVYLLIETDTQTRKDCAEELGGNFSYWGFKYYGVFWDSRVWERRGDATNEFLFRDKNNRWLLSLPLFHKESGKQITFDVTHLENDGDPGSDGHAARKVEMTHLVEKASKGNRVGFADINSTTPAIIAKPTARQDEKPRRILHKAGARWVSSLGSSKVKNLAYGSHHGGKSATKGPLIDDAWVFGDVQLVDAEIVRTDDTDASDHNGIKFRIKF